MSGNGHDNAQSVPITQKRDEFLIAQVSDPSRAPPLDLAAFLNTQFGALLAGRPVAPPQFSVLSNPDFSMLADQLDGPDFEVIERIAPKGLTAVSTVDSPPPPQLIVARMSPEKAESLKSTSGGRFLVTANPPLLMADAQSTAFAAAFQAPSVGNSVGAMLAFTIEVLGETAPLPNTQIYVYGSTGTTQGITDQNGRASFSFAQETASTIRGIMIQPAHSYWNILIRRPALSETTVNSIQLRSLVSTFGNLLTQDNFGWGQRAMRLDKLPADYRGQGIKIAVIDSGIDASHRDLSNVRTGFDFPRSNANTWRVDSIGHGSHCAGIISGVADNAFGVRGFAPDAEVHALRVLPEGRADDLVKALQYCIDHDIDVVNLSLGGVGGDPQAIAEISSIVEPYLSKAKSLGVACIAAAGNSSGPVLYPASSPNVLTVSAIGKVGEFPADSYHASLPLTPVQADGVFFPRFSCFGPEVEVAGPGVAIVSSVPGNVFVAWDGTSMAAPHITGLAALVLAHNPDFTSQYQARNAARVDHLFSILRQSAQPLNLGDPTRSGAGLPDAVAAVQPRVAVSQGASVQRPTPSAARAESGGLTAAQIADLTQRIAAALQGARPGGG
ncbi:S8 family serine peptidase [Methylobacterium sp. ID0610]|uniref:S8 family serine peptidase n=1 Tax=Methylobacterium carpenticola TaxID=3344827 RepID=UPI0036C4A314